MRHSPVASLLVAALVVLRQPCRRNRAAARLLLERAAEHDSLTAAEREACRVLADDLDMVREDTPADRPKVPAMRAARTDRGDERWQPRIASHVFSLSTTGWRMLAESMEPR